MKSGWHSRRESTADSFRAYIPLSSREGEILECISEGMTNKEIADRLFLSPETVKTHVSRMLKKIGARNRTEAVVRALEYGNGNVRFVFRGEFAGNQ